MTEKPAPPKAADDTYSDEEIAKRMEATMRAMIAMKPQPRAQKPRRLGMPGLLERDEEADLK
jgi:hypothetical protein